MEGEAAAPGRAVRAGEAVECLGFVLGVVWGDFGVALWGFLGVGRLVVRLSLRGCVFLQKPLRATARGPLPLRGSSEAAPLRGPGRLQFFSLARLLEKCIFVKISENEM